MWFNWVQVCLQKRTTKITDYETIIVSSIRRRPYRLCRTIRATLGDDWLHLLPLRYHGGSVGLPQPSVPELDHSPIAAAPSRTLRNDSADSNSPGRTCLYLTRTSPACARRDQVNRS